MASEFLNIPGNIKQMYLPFVLDKSNPALSIPIKYENSANSADHLAVETRGWTQYFSFSPHKIEASGEACSIDGTTYNDIKNGGLLHIAPYSLYHKEFLAVNDDISYSLLYNQHLNESLKISDILDSIPSIEIREYLQDAKLNMVFDLFQSFSNGMLDGLTSGENDQKENDNNKDVFKRLSKFGKRVWNFIKSMTTNFGEIMTAASSGLMDDQTFNINNPDYNAYVLKFPYMLYYRLMSATSTNIYNVPYNGNVLYESNGGGFSKGGLGGLTTNGSSIFGQFVNWFGKNIRINTTPTWDGPQDVPTKVDIDFSLYNDSLDGALKNFIFVNTIVPNNKWLQYHAFQHAPCLYDIKINGVNRLFMCQGDFKVEAKGVLRRPSPEFITTLAEKFTNENATALTPQALSENELVRIPDIYDVHMTFTSLLPNNFNNFLFANYANQTIREISGDKLHTESFLNPIASKLGKITKDVWNKSTSSYSPILDNNDQKFRVLTEFESNGVDK